MAEWLRRHLVDTGILTESGLSRTARPRRCPRCRAVTVAAIDDNGLESWADPHPIDAQAEADAALAGIPTWELWAGRELVRRDVYRITGRPAGLDQRRPVLAAHRCPTRRSETP